MCPIDFVLTVVSLSMVPSSTSAVPPSSGGLALAWPGKLSRGKGKGLRLSFLSASKGSRKKEVIFLMAVPLRGRKEPAIKFFFFLPFKNKMFY